MAAAGTATVAGCSALWEQTGATDVAVYNVADEPKTITVTITADGTEQPHTSRTLHLDPGAKVEAINRSKLPTNTGYTVDVAVDGGPRETFDWKNPDVELAPLYVLIDDSRNVKFLLQAG